MQILDYRNAQFSDQDNLSVDLEVSTNEYGWIPITIDIADGDTTSHIVIIKEWLTNNPAQIAAYVEPTPVVVIPVSVTMRQARLALLQQGHLSTVNTLMSGLSEASQIEWEYAQSVERTSALTLGMGAALVLTDEDLDTLFTLAATL